MTTQLESVGVYAAAEKLYVPMRNAFHPVANALYPFMAYRKHMRLYKWILAVGLAGAGLLAGIVYRYSESIV